MNRHLKDAIGMADQHVKRCSILLVMRKKQIKTTIRYFVYKNDKSKITISGVAKTEQHKLCKFLVVIKNGATNVKNSLQFLPKLKTHL